MPWLTTVPDPPPFFVTDKRYAVGAAGFDIRHDAVAPAFNPAQLHRYSVAESGSSMRVPAEQVEMAEPHTPFTGAGTRSNVALTLRALPILTTQLAPFVEEHPLHPPKVEPLAAEAVRVTEVPEANGATQELPQVIPAGEEVIFPLPAPRTETVKVCVTGLRSRHNALDPPFTPLQFQR
jgi:hypothetical protein